MYQNLIKLVNNLPRDEDNFVNEEDLNKFIEFCEKNSIDKKYPYGLNSEDPTMEYYFEDYSIVHLGNARQYEFSADIQVNREHRFIKNINGKHILIVIGDWNGNNEYSAEYFYYGKLIEKSLMYAESYKDAVDFLTNNEAIDLVFEKLVNKCNPL